MRSRSHAASRPPTEGGGPIGPVGQRCLGAFVAAAALWWPVPLVDLTVRSSLGQIRAIDALGRVAALEIRFALLAVALATGLAIGAGALAGPGVELFGVRLGDQRATMSLCLLSGCTLFFFLDASDAERWGLRPNNVLDGMIRRARETGLHRLHLGDGDPGFFPAYQGPGAGVRTGQP